MATTTAESTAESTALTIPSVTIIESSEITPYNSDNMLVTNDDIINSLENLFENLSKDPKFVEEFTKIMGAAPSGLLVQILEKAKTDLVNDVTYEIEVDVENLLKGGLIGGAPKYKCKAAVYWLVFLFWACIAGALYFYPNNWLTENIIWLYGWVSNKMYWIGQRSKADAELGYYTEGHSFLVKMFQGIFLIFGISIATLTEVPKKAFNASIELIMKILENIDEWCQNWPLLLDAADVARVDESERKAIVIKIMKETTAAVSITSTNTEQLNMEQIDTAMITGWFGQTKMTAPLYAEFENKWGQVNSAIITKLKADKVGALLITEFADIKKQSETQSIQTDMAFTQGSRLRPQAPASNASNGSNRASVSPAKTNVNAGITRYFPANKGPGGAPGGGGRRSRRRMQKSKRGGRSRMRKMRTKKRRMSKRKYRR